MKTYLPSITRYGFFAASLLVLTGCFSSSDSDDITALGGERGIETSQHNALANAKHVEHALLSKPQHQRHHPSNLGLASSAYPATVRKHGRVIDVIQAWPSNSSEQMVTYVVYGFLSPELYQTGQIPNSGAGTTEVWRYSAGGGGTWCPVITTGLNFSTAGVQALPSVNVASSNAVDISFITGSADGVVGKVSFRDTNPLASSCDNIVNDIQPIPGKSSFYALIQPAEGLGSVESFKLVDVEEGNIPDAQKKYQGYQYLLSWGLPACAGAWAVDKTGNCGTYGISPLRGLLLKNGEPVGNSDHIFQDPHGNRGTYFSVNQVSDADVVIKANDTGGIDFKYAMAFLKTTTDTAHSDRLRFGKTSITQLSEKIPEPIWIDAVDQTLVSHTAIPQKVTLSPTSDIVYVAYHGLTAPDKAQLLCDYQGNICKSTSPPVSNRGFPALESRFSKIRSFVPNEVESLMPFNTDTYVLRTAPYYTNIPIPTIQNDVMNSQSTNPHNYVSSTLIGFDSNMLFQYRDQGDYASYSQVTAMAVGDFEGFVTFDSEKNQSFLHQVFQFNDYGGYDQDGTQHQATHGGVAHCISPIGADGGLSLGACNHPRLNREDNTGFSYALASHIAKGGTYLTTPDKVRYSVSPTGKVNITYISSASAISTINASEKTTDWTGQHAWVTISSGQVAECNAVLSKPAKPDPLVPDTFWEGVKKNAFKKTASFIVKEGVKSAAGPLAGILVGFGMDAIFSMNEKTALKKREDDQYAAWTKVYDEIQLKTACKAE